MLKNPPDGVKVIPETWLYFTLMDDAMEGRLKGKAPVITAFPNHKDSADFLHISEPRKRKFSTPAASVASGSEIVVSLIDNEDGEEEAVREGNSEINCIMQEMEDERNMESQRQLIEREKRVMEKERLVLQRERAMLDREIAALDRDRASLERERVAVDREKSVIERERVMAEKDRDALNRDKCALEQEKARLEKFLSPKERTEEVTGDKTQKDSDVMGRKERFLYLFEKLVEKL